MPISNAPARAAASAAICNLCLVNLNWPTSIANAIIPVITTNDRATMTTTEPPSPFAKRCHALESDRLRRSQIGDCPSWESPTAEWPADECITGPFFDDLERRIQKGALVISYRDMLSPFQGVTVTKGM
jgi:hypothetical protein